MKISEMVKELEALRQQIGDAEVVIDNVNIVNDVGAVNRIWDLETCSYSCIINPILTDVEEVLVWG